MFGRRRERFLATYCFPSGLQTKFAATRPELSATDRALALEGLRDWFAICRSGRARTFYAMPSRVVDDAWHEFILFTREYRDFCRRALGRYLDHTPAEGLTDESRMEDGMLATWRAACALEGIDHAAADRLPRIFAIDERVGVEEGFRFIPEPGALQPFRSLRRAPTATGAAWLPVHAAGCAGGAFAGCGGGGSAGCGGGGGCGGGCGGG